MALAKEVEIPPASGFSYHPRFLTFILLSQMEHDLSAHIGDLDNPPKFLIGNFRLYLVGFLTTISKKISMVVMRETSSTCLRSCRFWLPLQILDSLCEFLVNVANFVAYV